MNSIAMPSSALQLGEQLQDLRLHGDVERRRRLVGDQQVRLVGERHGDHHALALPARQLVRIGAEPLLRRRGCRPASQQFERARARRLARTGPGAASRISPTCRSIVCSGLSEVIGSWNTMVMSLPRTLRSSSSDGVHQIAALEQDLARGMATPADRAAASGPRAP